MKVKAFALLGILLLAGCSVPDGLLPAESALPATQPPAAARTASPAQAFTPTAKLVSTYTAQPLETPGEPYPFPPTENGDWQVYTDQSLGFSFRHPVEWTLEHRSPNVVQLARDSAVLTIGARRVGELPRIHRTGVGAGDLVEAGQLTILGTPVDRMELIYEGKLMTVLYSNGVNFAFDELVLALGLDDRELDRQQAGLTESEVEEAEAILSSFTRSSPPAEDPALYELAYEVVHSLQDGADHYELAVRRDEQIDLLDTGTLPGGACLRSPDRRTLAWLVGEGDENYRLRWASLWDMTQIFEAESMYRITSLPVFRPDLPHALLFGGCIFDRCAVYAAGDGRLPLEGEVFGAIDAGELWSVDWGWPVGLLVFRTDGQQLAFLTNDGSADFRLVVLDMTRLYPQPVYTGSYDVQAGQPAEDAPGWVSGVDFNGRAHSGCVP